MNTGEHGLSWTYRTLGCYHSLQPTPSAFETPAVPCLTDEGYVRWQTLQLLLCPQEHAAMLQKALQKYDVPRKNGGYFPKDLPRECFPSNPDPDMERWYRFVTSQMNQDNLVQRIKYSPYQSPQPESNNSPGGYFNRTSRHPSPHFRRRESTSEEAIGRQEAAREAARRRSSVPDIITPGGTPLRAKDTRDARSRSANRPKSGDYGNRPNQQPYTGLRPAYYPPPQLRPVSGGKPPRDDRKRSSKPKSPYGNQYERTRSFNSRSSTASDAESENFNVDRYKSRSSEEENSKRRSRWGSSLMPSFFLSNSKRRHSSDGRVPTLNRDQRSPRRGDSIRKYKTEGTEFPPPERLSNGVRFSNVQFDPNVAPARPDTSTYQQPPPPPTSYRYSEPQPTVYPAPHIPNMRPSFPIPSDAIPNQPPIFGQPMPNNHFEARKQGQPVRVATVGGVNGRRYAPIDASSPNEPVAFNRRNRTASMRNPVTSTVI